MNSEGKLISAIINHLVYSGDRKRLETLIESGKVDWKQARNLIAYHELSPFAYSALKDFNSFIPQDLIEFFKNEYYFTMARQLTFEREFLKICKALAKEEITVVPIKGMALVQDVYLKKPPRPMADIDLLIKEEELQKSEKIFCTLGYGKLLHGSKEEYWRKNQCHIAFSKNQDNGLLVAELHWGIDFKRKNRIILPELWGRIREVDVDGRIIKLLSPEDTLFSLVLHNRRYGKTLCLKSVYDLIMVLTKYAANFDWPYVLKQSKEYKLCSAVFFILCQVKFISNVNIPSFVWAGLKLPFLKKKTIQRFIEKNTFSTNSLLKNNKYLYLRSHFLLYDSLCEPIIYIINIPKEQFAKFYQLKQYDRKTDFFYRIRLLYFPLKLLSSIFKK